MGINSRTKGATAEREFSNAIYEWAGVRLVRNLQQSRSGGYDLIVHDDEAGQVADAYRGLAIEIKRHAAVTPALIKKWWQQAVAQASPKNLTPILAYRADRQDWQVITPLYLINAAMSRNLGLESTAVLSVGGFCGVVSEVQ
ncbi:MAG: hypothetical protein WCP96_20745 [Methylococcaceae bacterium]